MALTISDILTRLLVEADYPEVKREGFINTFYEYLFMKLLIELEESEPEVYNKLVGNSTDGKVTDEGIKEAIAEAYGKPELKVKIDKVLTEVTQELAADINQFASEPQKQNIVAGVS